MTKTSPTTTGSDDEAMAGNTNRTSSEIYAATHLVGIGGVPTASNIKIEVTEDKEPDDDSSKADSKITAEGGDNIDTEPKGLGEVVVPADAKDAVAVAMGNDDKVEKEEGEKTAFPILLHEIVTDPATDDCIHWLTCGTRFMISDKKKFADDILPRFYGHAKFTSFTRRLKRWSFTRVPSGPFMGSYHNPNFRRGEPELAARVRYDHPAQLSASAMQLSKQQLKLQAAAGGMGMGGVGGLGGMFGGNLLLGAGGQMHQLSNEDREMLLRQMNLMNGAGGGNMMGMGGLGGIDSLYRAMGQSNAQGGNLLGGINSSALLQMAMAQEAMQQRQQSQLGQMDQARLMAQQQLQQQWNNPNMSTMLNSAVQGQQQGGQGGQTPEDQRMLAAMFLEHLNKQQQQQQQQQQLSGQSNLNNLQQQFNFASHGGGGGGGGGSGPNTSVGSTTNNQQQGQQMNFASMTGGNGNGGGDNSGSNNWGNLNSLGQMGVGGGGGGGGLSGNPMGMSALLADYLRRAGGAPTNGGGGGGGENVVKEEGGNNMTEAFC